MTAYVTLATNDMDWEGFYLNGILVEEGCDIGIEAVFRTLAKYGVINYSEKPVSAGWLDYVGNLPERLDDVVFDE